MVHDRSDAHESGAEEIDARSPSFPTQRSAPRSPFALASLLDLDEDDLAQPVSRVAPAERCWEHLSFAVAPETGEAGPSTIRAGSSADILMTDHSLVPGLEVPGAVEVPVYLAGKTLQALLTASAPHQTADRIAGPTHGVGIIGDVGDAERLERPAVPPPEPQKPSQQRALVSTHAASADRDRPRWRGVRDIATALLASRSREVRTIAALVLAPGELTTAHLAGRTRRYVGPVGISVLTLVVFTVISMFGSLRPRPDRSVGIGSEQTVEFIAGLRDPSPVDLASEEAPGLLRDLASALNFAPVLWLPLTAVLVLGVVALLRHDELGDGEAAMVFTAHAMGWFVLWWGVGVPALLLLLRMGFEFTAGAGAASTLTPLASGAVTGVSAGWSAARSVVGSGEFHSLLLVLGFGPWVGAAWRRTFAEGQARATVAGVLITAVPVLLLVPFI